MTGRMLNQAMGQFHFWVTFIGAYMIFLPIHYLGFLGVPRRYFELGETSFIPDSVQSLNAFITVTALIVGFSQLVFLFNLAWSYFKGKDAGRNPWKANSLEWQTPSIPPAHGNFGTVLPVTYRWPYDFGVPGVKDDFIPQNVPPDQVAKSESR